MPGIISGTKCQIARAVNRYLGHADAGEVICHQDVFRDDPDDRVGHVDIAINSDWQNVGARQHREALAAELDQVRKRICDIAGP